MTEQQSERLDVPAEVVREIDLPVPEPGLNRVVNRELAAPASFPDAVMCRGECQAGPDLPFTLGIETCIEVVAAGDSVTRYGDRCSEWCLYARRRPDLAQGRY